MDPEKDSRKSTENVEPNGAAAEWRRLFQSQTPAAHHAPQQPRQDSANTEGSRNTQPPQTTPNTQSYDAQQSQQGQQQPQLVQYALQQAWHGNGGNVSSALVPGLHPATGASAPGTVVVAPGATPFPSQPTASYAVPQGVEYRPQGGPTGLPVTMPNGASWTPSGPPPPGQGQASQQHGQPLQVQVQGQQIQLPVQHQQQQLHVQQGMPMQDRQQQAHQQAQHGVPTVMYYTSGPQHFVQHVPIGQQVQWQQQAQQQGYHHRQPYGQAQSRQPQHPMHFQHQQYPRYPGDLHRGFDDDSMDRGREATRWEKKRGRGDEQEAGTSQAKGKAKGAAKGIKVQRRTAEALPPPEPMVDDGVPYAPSSDSPGALSPSNSKKAKKNKAKAALQAANANKRKPLGTNHPSEPVADANRQAGEGHWGTLLKGALPPLEGELEEQAKQRQLAQQGVEGNGQKDGKDGNTVEALTPIGMEQMDPVAYKRMYPGGAIVNVKGFDVKDKSAVSAAFELCVAMDPKTRPKFEFKDNTKTKVAPFTLHVVVHGVQYTEATAKSMKLAKQLAAINFLREAIGTRMNLDLSKLLQDGAGGAAASAAIKAAVAKGNAPGGAEGGKGGGKKGEVDEVTRAALGDGKANYAQLLHDLVAAHHQTPTYASYSFTPLKDSAKPAPAGGKGESSSDASNAGFECSAKLLRHVVNVEETSRLKQEEKSAREKAEVAQKAADSDPENKDLSNAAEVAVKAYEDSKTGPKLDISVLTSSGEGPSKREAKHKAAEAMIYMLLPECKTDDEMRAEAKRIMDEYHVEKKARMEEEQRVAQENKARREAAEAAAKAAKAEAKAARAAKAEAARAEAMAAKAAKLEAAKAAKAAKAAAAKATEENAQNQEGTAGVKDPVDSDGKTKTSDGDSEAVADKPTGSVVENVDDKSSPAGEGLNGNHTESGEAAQSVSSSHVEPGASGGANPESQVEEQKKNGQDAAGEARTATDEPGEAATAVGSAGKKVEVVVVDVVDTDDGAGDGDVADGGRGVVPHEVGDGEHEKRGSAEKEGSGDGQGLDKGDEAQREDDAVKDRGEEEHEGQERKDEGGKGGKGADGGQEKSEAMVETE